MYSEEEECQHFMKIPKSGFRISKTVSTFVCAVGQRTEIDRLWMRITGCELHEPSFEKVRFCLHTCFCTGHVYD